MQDENQIVVPPSFLALHQDRRGRLMSAPDTVRERYELCEDLACSLVDRAQQLLHEAPSEQGILRQMHAALADTASGLTPEEARWVALRLAELLGWHSPDLPSPGVTPP